MTIANERLAVRIIALIALLLASPCGMATDTVSATKARPENSETITDEWMALLVNGQKSGYLHNRRQHSGKNIISSMHMRWQLQRGGIPLSMEITENSTETRDGRPVAFSSRQQLAGFSQQVNGRLDKNRQLHLTETSFGQSRTEIIPWQDDWLLSEGLRRQQLAAFRKQGMKPGNRHSALVFVPSLKKAVPTTTVLGNMENVDLLGQNQRLRHVIETTDMGGFKQVAEAWVDEQFNVKKMRMHMMGMTLDMIACPKACATAADKPFEAFGDTLARVPHALSPTQLQQPLRWTLRLKTPVKNLRLPDSLEQHSRIETAADGSQLLHVTVYPDQPTATHTPNPTVKTDTMHDWVKPTPWLQSRNKLIVSLARKAVKQNQTDAEKMQAITNFVRDYITDKSLSVAYASALETAKYRNGDCTEHALLVAAMGRALGIPTRIATGLVYAPEFNGKKNVLVPHAWTQAFVNGAWKSHDAAIGRFDSSHIALSYSDGDPAVFYNGIQLIGNMEVLTVSPTNNAATTQSSASNQQNKQNSGNLTRQTQKNPHTDGFFC